jgi:hypothetical protein
MPEYTERQGQYLAFIYYYTNAICNLDTTLLHQPQIASQSDKGSAMASEDGAVEAYDQL